MKELEGYVEHIVYRNEENGYTVLSLVDDDGQEEMCVGSFPFINEGEYIVVRGNEVFHPTYGEQLKVESYEVKEPEDIIAVQRYLASGAIKGIGGGLAKRITDKFGEKTFDIMEKEPERLSEVKGISEKKALDIAEQFAEKKGMRNALLFLQQYGISNQLAVKIYNEYHEDLYETVQKNPYKLAEDITGVGFKIADEIGRRIGIQTNSSYRIRAGILYVLSLGGGSGHVFLPKDLLLRNAEAILGVSGAEIEDVLEDMAFDKSIIVKAEEDTVRVYSAAIYYAELNCARMLLDLNGKTGVSKAHVEYVLEKVKEQEEIELDDKQLLAVKEALTRGVLIITGGPGTGKTTTINTIIRVLKNEGLEILLAAPTGRAAKRMSETTGEEAQTIHRLLQYSGGVDGDNENGDRFEKNEWNPLEADVIIIDEMSMVDIYLFHYLLKAITVGTRVIFVGDVNQLPSVGPGNVLRDMIEAECFSVVWLDKIFRQAAQSDIIVNAHKINAGENISLDNQSKDFFCLPRENSHGVLEVMLWLVRDKMPKYCNCTPFEVQVLTPMKKGELGVIRCNEVLQKYLNPPAPEKSQVEAHGVLFREGDKVMQVKNNYQITWEVRGYSNMRITEGSGVFNGDTGVIKKIDNFSKEMVVEFDDNRQVTYPFSGLNELELSYAITIHKSQGSEYPAVVLPLLGGPDLLMNRNLLYTAVTRGKQCVTIVGSEQAVQKMIQNKSEQKRYSTLALRIQEMW